MFIKSHGSVTNVFDLKIGKTIETKLLSDQITSILRFLDASTLCLGFPLEYGKEFVAMVSHQSGELRSTNRSNLSTQDRAFSPNCEVIGNMCSRCRQLQKVYKTRNKRKRSAKSLSINCNKRYLTSREKDTLLTEERNKRYKCAKRETYWKTKYDVLLEMQEDDHTDLSAIFKSSNRDDVPEDMHCLWEQQAELLTKTSKKGYRWHPK